MKNKFGYDQYLICDKANGYGQDEHYVFKFPNDRGASVISGRFALGNTERPYELAVLWFRGEDYELDYGTEITNNVVGYLTVQDVTKILEQILNMPK